MEQNVFQVLGNVIFFGKIVQMALMKPIVVKVAQMVI